MSVWRHGLLVAAAIAISCAPAPYRPEVALTDNFFQSTDGLLRGRIPSGWLSLSETELPPHLAGCLFREDYSALLTFEEIKVDSHTAAAVVREGIVLLANISLSLKQADEPSLTVLKQPQAFTLDGKQCARYEYRGREQQASVVIFHVKNRYVESVAILRTQISQNPDAQFSPSYETLLKLQEAVIWSIEVKVN